MPTGNDPYQNDNLPEPDNSSSFPATPVLEPDELSPEDSTPLQPPDDK